MSKHTPGPWVFGIFSYGEGSTLGVEEKPFDYTGPGYYDNPSIIDKNGNEIVGCGEYDVFSSPENTRLMVAAPDLLEALEELFQDYKQLADSGDAGIWKLEDQESGKRAIKAMAKAKGE